ncbi:MAG TPA: carboxypeptidase-like regulatory domain-containing protein, partial [Ignavibacteriaceae bacterium]|nr:carboxypeptidase-like regulatory domain-containing protein [Ignavibacteriaceae bacterium]
MFNYPNVLLSIYIILISNVIFAQSLVKGYVIDDKSDEKIPNAVLVINNSKNYLSDSTGFFSFNLPDGKYDIQINALG